jgi:glycosyltransferase involved in cell wall biosynthesis
MSSLQSEVSDVSGAVEYLLKNDQQNCPVPAVENLVQGNHGLQLSAPPAAAARRCKRVLAFGHCSSAFVPPLYRELARALPGLEVDVLGFVSMAEKIDDEDKAVFRRFHECSPATFDWNFIAGLARAAFQPNLWWRLWCRLLAGGILNRETLREIMSSARLANLKACEQYDLYHLHFCTAETLRLIDIIPSDAKLICSFWGSDLLRTHGAYQYLNQSRALERADIITVQSFELREILLAKFGRHLLSRIRCLCYPLDERLYQSIENVLAANEGSKAFRDKLNVPEGRLMVAVGHNGNPANNHLAIINALSSLPSSVKDAAVWVFPMKFNNNESYIDSVENAATVAGLNFRVITQYLDWPDLAAFRVATDVLIHLPISDALSATVLETIYGGGCVITGSWFPYSPFRKAELPLAIVDHLSDVPNCLSDVFERLDQWKRKAAEAHGRIREHFFSRATVPAWAKVYRDLLCL